MVEKIKYWDFGALEELPDDREFCPHCKRRILIRNAIKHDTKRFAWYLRFFEKGRVSNRVVEKFLLGTDLFVNIQGNKEGDVEFMNTLQATFRRLEEKTGIYTRPHMLRHSYAQSRLDAGWKLPMIANVLGHKDIRTTELYLKIPEKERLVALKEYLEMYGSFIDEEETIL